MEENNVEAPQPQENKKVLSLIGIEAAIVLIVALIVVGVLNYFNILSLSKNYPQIFGFLPHQQYGVNTSLSQDAPASTKPQISKEQAQKDLLTYAKQTFSVSALPQSFDVKSFMNSNGAVSDPSYFTASWKTKDDANILLGYKYNEGFQDKNILVTLPKFLNATIDNAKKNTQKYFDVIPQGEWKCGNAKGVGSSVRICENFWLDSQKLKHGIGITALSSVQTTGVFYCELYPGTVQYGTLDSCSGGVIEFE